MFDFFAEKRLTPGALRASYRRQVELLAASFDVLAVPDDVVTCDRGVLTDTRAEWLRLGPAPYLSDSQLEEAVGVLGSVARGSLAPR